VVLLGVLAVRISVRLGLPSLLLYLAIGILLGESVLGIQFSDAGVTEAAGLGALVLILTEGGITTRWAAVRRRCAVGIALSTVAVVGASSWSAPPCTPSSAWTGERRSSGARCCRRPTPRRCSACCAGGGEQAAAGRPGAGVGNERRAGGARRRRARVGRPGSRADAGPRCTSPGRCGRRYALGRAGAWALRRAALPSTGLYPLAAIACCLLAYSAGTLAHASGLLATYAAALVLGNSNLPHRGDVLSFAEGTGWLAQIGLFVLLGLYASPIRLLDAVVPALIAGVVLVVAARPLSVIVAAAPFRVPWREQAFLSWSGLRGAVPIVLALVALQEGRRTGSGWSMPSRARRRPHSPAGHDAAVRGAPARRGGGRASGDRGRRRPTGRAGCGPAAGPGAGARLRGVYLREPGPPRGATVSLVVRDEEAFTPDG
jgi:cell volume regulation protein A